MSTDFTDPQGAKVVVAKAGASHPCSAHAKWGQQMYLFRILMVIVVGLSASMSGVVVASAQSATAKQVRERAIAEGYKPTRYRGQRAYDCIDCAGFHRIYPFHLANNARMQRAVQASSGSQQEATEIVRRLVRRLVSGKVDVVSADIKKQGSQYVLNSVFETEIGRGGTLRNVGRIIFTNNGVYGAVGVSIREATSRSLMQKGLAWVK
ncbi:MAG: hypothetical protein AAF940_10500 [Pseudomonadota bacterium]